MPTLNNFRCSILVDDKPMREYVDPDVVAAKDLKTNKITRYVEAELGAKFAIGLRIHSKFAYKDADCVEFRIFLDGVYRTSTYISKAEHSEAGPTLHIVDSCIVHTKSGAQCMKFCFSSIATRETEKGEDVHAMRVKYKDLSSIKIVVWRTEDGELRAGSPESVEDLTRESIANKVLKGDARDLSIGWEILPCPSAWFLTFGRVEPGEIVTLSPQYTEMECLDAKPLATFILKPRTREALRQLHVLPREPTPPPLRDRPIESLTKAERARLIEELKAEADAAKVKIKQERQERTLGALHSLKRARTEDDDEEDSEIEVLAERLTKRRRPTEGDTVLGLD